MLKSILMFLLGCITGSSLIWVHSYSDNEREHFDFSLAQVLKSSHVKITSSNFSCENVGSDVGSVLASIVESNLGNRRNHMAFNCVESACSIRISNCKPWQSSECGSRYLKFNIAQAGKIDPSSFACIDVP